MKDLQLTGVVRGGGFVVTTRRGDDSGRAPDLVTRNFTATRPNQLWVSDVHTTDVYVNTAFVSDALARRPVGWRVSHAMRTDGRASGATTRPAI